MQVIRLNLSASIRQFNTGILPGIAFNNLLIKKADYLLTYAAKIRCQDLGGQD